MGRKTKTKPFSILPKDGSCIWVRIERGVWWPGYSENGKGCFYDEEDYISLNKSNWKYNISEEQIGKSLGKLKNGDKKKFLQDLEVMKSEKKKADRGLQMLVEGEGVKMAEKEQEEIGDMEEGIKDDGKMADVEQEIDDEEDGIEDDGKMAGVEQEIDDEEEGIEDDGKMAGVKQEIKGDEEEGIEDDGKMACVDHEQEIDDEEEGIEDDGKMAGVKQEIKGDEEEGIEDDGKMACVDHEQEIDDEEEGIEDDGKMAGVEQEIDDEEEGIEDDGKMACVDHEQEIDDEEEGIKDDGKMAGVEQEIDDEEEGIEDDGKMAGVEQEIDDEEEGIEDDGKMACVEQEIKGDEEEGIKDNGKMACVEQEIKGDEEEGIEDNGKMACVEQEIKGDEEEGIEDDGKMACVEQEKIIGSNQHGGDASPSGMISLIDDRMRCPFCCNSYRQEQNLFLHIKTCHKDGSHPIIAASDDDDDSYCSEIWPELSGHSTKQNKKINSSDEDGSFGDPEYLPDEFEWLDADSEASDEKLMHEVFKPTTQPALVDLDNSVFVEHLDTEEASGSDTLVTDCVENISVSQTRKSKEGKRIYDKRHACFYCNGTYAKISDHLQNKHSSEMEVAHILSKKKGSIDRKLGWKKLRNKGNFHHNLKVISEKKGSLIVDRRPKHVKDSDEFLPCTHCLGFYLSQDLWRHVKECPLKGKVVQDSCVKNLKLSAKLLLHSTISGSDDKFMEVLAGMKQDVILDAIKTDTCILKLGSSMLKKVGTSRKPNVRQKVREVGRLLVHLRQVGKKPSAVIGDFLNPKCFDLLVQGVQSICTVKDTDTQCVDNLTERGCPKYNRPTLALKLGHTLKKMAQIKRGQALRDDDIESKKQAEEYMMLHDAEWADKVSTHAHQSISERKFNEPNFLPLTADIVKFRNFLLKELLDLGKALEGPELSPTLWRNLALTCLCRVTVFNKRRGGEAGQMLLSVYENRTTNWKEAENTEITSTLQPIEVKLMDRLELVEIVGKRNRKVPVLLTEDMRNAIDILVAKRADVGVPENNKYLFAAPSTENGYLRGWDALNIMTRKAGLQKAELLTSTNLRKYVATVSQVIDLGSKNELEWLANHMGHTITVHRQFYRLQEQTLELAKVSKLLVAIDNGTCHKYAGKSLDQLTLEELPDARSNDEDVDDNENSSNASLDSLNQKQSSNDELMLTDTDSSDEKSEDSDVEEEEKKSAKGERAKKSKSLGQMKKKTS